MKSALVATALLAASAGQAEIAFDCAAFRKGPDGVWTAVRTTRVTIANKARRTLAEFSIEKGSNIRADRAAKRPSAGEPVAALVDQLIADADVVGALEERCR